MIEDLSTIIIFVGIVLSCMGFCTLIMGLISYWTIKKKSTYIPIITTCIKHERSVGGLHGSDFHRKKPVYEAKYKNKKYEFCDILMTESTPKVGDQRKFFIDPTNPRNYYIEGKPEEYKDIASMGLVCIIIGAVMLCLNFFL